MNLFWEIMKQKKERKQAIRNNAEFKDLLVQEEVDGEEQQEIELKNDTLLNSIIEFLLVYVNSQNLIQDLDNIMFSKR